MSIGHWDYHCFDTYYHEFMSLFKLNFVHFLNLFLFFIRFNSGEVVPYFNTMVKYSIISIYIY